MPKIDEVFKETYPQLAEQLEELGISYTSDLGKRFESNGKYLSEVLEYDLKDYEKIRTMSEDAQKKYDFESEKQNGVVGIVSALIVLGMIFYFLYKVW